MSSALRVILCKGRFAGPISGSDETLVAYAVQMKAAGHDVAVAVVYPHAGDDPYYVRLRDAGVPVSVIADRSLAARLLQSMRKRVPHLAAGPRRLLHKTGYGVSMRYAEACRDYFQRVRPDVVHVITPDPAAMAMIRGAHEAGVPVLYQELGTPDYLPELQFYYEQLGHVLALCDATAALSPALAARFSEKLGGNARTSVLPLMVEDVPPAPASQHSAGVTFGFAGRVEYGKGPLALIDAFARVKATAGPVSLRIAGVGPQLAEVQALARLRNLNGDCAFLGTYGPATRNAFMRSIDVLVLPTLAEGTPNSIAEAMAHCIPVIASAVGGIPDMLSGESGLLVAPGDIGGLTAAMTQLATDPQRRAAMGRAARARYEAMFSPAAVLPLLRDHYARLAGEPAAPPRSHPWASS